MRRGIACQRERFLCSFKLFGARLGTCVHDPVFFIDLESAILCNLRRMCFGKKRYPRTRFAIILGKVCKLFRENKILCPDLFESLLRHGLCGLPARLWFVGALASA